MTTLGRYPRVVADAPAFDLPYNALPGVDQDAFIRSNIPIWAAGSNLAATATGVAIGTRIFLRAGDVVTSLTFMSATTAAGTPTNWWHALYSEAGALLAQSADQLTAAWAADTAKKLALSAPVTISADGWYIAATAMTATTVQTLAGTTPNVGHATLHTGSRAVGFTFGSAVAGTAPATTGTQTAVAKCPLAIVS